MAGDIGAEVAAVDTVPAVAGRTGPALEPGGGAGTRNPGVARVPCTVVPPALILSALNSSSKGKHGFCQGYYIEVCSK